MSLLEKPIGRPVSVVVGAIFVGLFGLLAAFRLPIQLTPNVDRPIVTVTTLWEGASPREVEREILEEQEDKLKSIEGLYKMTSTATEGRGEVSLEFRVGMDTTRAKLDVNEKLRQVPAYPENVDEPIITSGDVRGANAIAWVILQCTPDSPIAPEDLPKLQTLLEEEVKPQLERAEGIAGVEVFGGVEREVHIRVDPARLAARKLTLLDVRSAIRSRNVDITAGDLDQGKHAFSVRTTGKFESIPEIENLVLARRNGQPVFLRDVGTVAFGYKEPMAVVRSVGLPAVAMSASRKAGTNVIEVMRNYQAAIASVNENTLEPKGLRLVQVYDQTDYIYSAMDLVWQNLLVGGLLALIVLLLFLREVRSTFIVGLAIPISVVGSFVGLAVMGRNLNVISLAGLAFAVGMVVDNSIVVLENIYRHRQQGESPARAAVRGAQEVWGAVMASTFTTLAVFVPVIFVEEEAGQLFRDIAIAISAAVLLSLLVSVLFVPTVAAQLLGRAPSGGGSRPWWVEKVEAVLLPLAVRFTSAITSAVAWLCAAVGRRLATAAALVVTSLLLAWILLPPTAYLPGGNQNLVIGFMIPPPGYNMAEFERIAEKIESGLRPYWNAGREGGEIPPDLSRPAWYTGAAPIPAVKNFFFVALGNSVFMGAASENPDNVRPLEQLLMHAGEEIPGSILFASQRSLFEQGVASGDSIDLEIGGSDFGDIRQAAMAIMGAVMQDPDIGPRPPRPEPANFNLGAPELRIEIDEAHATELGLGVQELGFILRCMIDGAVVSDYRDRGVTIDVKLLTNRRAGPLEEHVEDLAYAPLFTPANRQVPLSAVAAISEVTAPNEIRRVEKKRSVNLVVTPPRDVELSRAMEIVSNRILPTLRAGGMIPRGVSATLSGTADKLVSTRRALQWDLLLAVVISYLLMASLFESFLFPMVILLSVPLAGVGGILGLRIVHDLTGQQMDVLTMLGFVILVGTVVNNAILIVHQALNNMREAGLESREAVVHSVRTRVRPIFMSTMTSVFGMLPLVLFPGSGSELYRGLGSVVVGGLISSTLFTLILTPVLFTLALDTKRVVRGWFPGSRNPESPPTSQATPEAQRSREEFVILNEGDESL